MISGSHRDSGEAVRGGDVHHRLRREEDGGAGTMVQWAREEEEWTRREE